MRVTVSLLAILGLAACGGGGGGSRAERLSYDQLGKQGTTIIAKYKNASVTDASAMPKAGKATYNGVAAFVTDEYFVDDVAGIADDADVLAKMTLRADFRKSTVSGNLTNFVGPENEKASGTVALGEAEIVGSEFDGGTVSGRIHDHTNKTDIVVNGHYSGAFVGPNAKGAVGLMMFQANGVPVTGVFGVEK